MKSTTSNDNIWVAAGDGQLERVKELLENGMDANIRDDFGYTPIHAAVSYNQKEMLEYLLNHGGDINVEDLDKDTPLYVCETVDMAKFMLDRGADASHKNSDGVTAAWSANEEGWKEVAQFLATITGEVLEDDQPTDDLAYIQRESDAQPDEQLEDEASQEAFAQQVEQVMRNIQEQGGVHDEEELREVVTKMVLSEVKRTLQEQQKDQ
ncbi:ankyrin [Halteromyces radiatus]|uniref:ankyrin n=1 Tax=Halteromyces radiatus TaxID=101107 RepID=UPI002220D16A|nr:ankyrin [Halteromyces radiatus]KAI8096612.1 ankyrin [Halteromyces radiatus]